LYQRCTAGPVRVRHSVATLLHEESYHSTPDRLRRPRAPSARNPAAAADALMPLMPLLPLPLMPLMPPPSSFRRLALLY
jgi:hypothetical protein